VCGPASRSGWDALRRREIETEALLGRSASLEQSWEPMALRKAGDLCSGVCARNDLTSNSQKTRLKCFGAFLGQSNWTERLVTCQEASACSRVRQHPCVSMQGLQFQRLFHGHNPREGVWGN